MAWKEYCAEYWLRELQESINRYTGHSNITEILLKTALNTIQSGEFLSTYVHIMCSGSHALVLVWYDAL